MSKESVEAKKARMAEKRRASYLKKISTEEGLTRHREQSRRGMARMKAIGREVFIPPCEDTNRKESCRNDLLLFCKTYFPHYTYLPFADYHLEIIKDFQSAIMYGRSQAAAAPRGGGKDTIFAMAVIWAIAYGHRKWLVYGGATFKLAKAKLENIKIEIEENQLLCADFPEMCVPVRALERSPQRAKGQRIKSHSGDAYFSRIEWGQDEIQFAVVEGADCSGSKISATGVEAAARGLVRGELRPDFLCVNDVETDEGARSEVIKKKAENTIDQSLSGLAGPGMDIAKFMLCTIVCPGCMSETYTDPSIKHDWNGKRYRMVEKFPDREDLWQEYMDLWRSGKSSGKDPDARIAHKFYVANRKEMDRGAVVSWKERYIQKITEDGSPREISALQHAYNLRVALGETAFFSEYQNDPLPENQDTIGLTASVVASRCGGYAQGIIPENAVSITAGIDIGARELHKVITAWMSNGDNYIVDYSRIPVEAPKGDLRNAKGHVKAALEAAILDALRLARSESEDFPMRDTAGNERFISMTLIDAKFQPKVIHKFVKESGVRYRAINGYGSKSGQKRYTPPDRKSKVKKLMYHCYASPVEGKMVYHIDADHWKLFVQNRFAQDPGTVGACSLFGMDPAKHRNFANHIVAELYDPTTGKWEEQSKHNHFLDATAYSACAGGMCGIRIQSFAAKPDMNQQDVTSVKPRRDREHNEGPKMVSPSQKSGGARVVKRRPDSW